MSQIYHHKIGLFTERATFADMKNDTITNYDLTPSTSGEERFRLRHMPEAFAKEGLRNEQLHTHSFYTIIWFQRGEGEHFVDFDHYPVLPGRVFFLSPGQLHCFDSRHNQTGYILEFSDDFLQDEMSSESLFLKYDVFNAFDTLPYRDVTPSASVDLQTLTNAIQRELENVDAFAHHDTLAMLVRLFLIAVQRAGQIDETRNSLTFTSPKHRLFVRFRQTLECNFSHIHTVQEYAHQLGITAKTLTNCTLECAHQTPLALINERLLLEARRLLKYTDLTSKEVAFQLGFDDPSYFVKFFKRGTGLLPLDFRGE